MLALEGIRIIDFTTWAFAPGSCAILADWGADVIKIEDPTSGDPHRGLFMVAGVGMPDINFPWEFDNRNKRGMAVDLRTDEGKEILYKLVEGADVFVSNLQSAALEKLGVDYKTLSGINPKLIYAHGTGYGKEGPEATRAGYDYAAFWARGGIMRRIGEPGSPPPMALPGLGDSTGSITLAAGITLALLVRERTGVGQEVSVALLGTALWCNGITITGAGLLEKEPPRRSRKESPNPIYNSYECKDGKWVMLVCLQSDRYWADFCRVMGLEALEKDPRFGDMFKRVENCAELISILDESFITKDREEIGEAFDQNGILWTPVQTAREAVNDPQALANGFIVEVEHPTHGKFRNVASPIQFSKTPAGIRSNAPELGQHTEEILLELGYSWDDITAFKDAKAIL
jgi:crotonobetainyl-CoA:carnitine CoA-transferase CaiB-like acyl-CoA transferase